MFLNKKVYYQIFIGINILLFLSCSSSSVQQRYNKPEEKETNLDRSPRFTSDDDTDPSKSTTNNSEFDEEPIEENPVDVNDFISKQSIRSKTSSQLSDREKVLFEVVKYINTPYQYGGANKKGIDCSSFTQNVFSKSINYPLPRTASQQFKIGTAISSQNNLIFGDLIFFDTTKNSYPGHVGIYLGEGLFAHSSSSRGVTVSSINNNYYQNRFVGGRRTAKIAN